MPLISSPVKFAFFRPYRHQDAQVKGFVASAKCLVPRDARYEVTAIDEQVFSRVSSNGSRYEDNLVVIHLRDAE